ncbi:hypothetical protein NA57DRAFT_60349 [Rhizodiscina lignyota]|uniref:Uncharacterized protein n=1 Tax=Rhizodiscina lignyota TaxID=1504668 RepID=A0A9P4M547_9PEZI|nr:hypothetical protein NA57DRAFT_60349 [Rhizodiscina lignyota]
MAPIPNNKPPEWTRIVLGVLGGLIGIPLGLMLLFFLVTIFIYLASVLALTIGEPNYREWNRLRKEWNKAAAKERRRRFIWCVLYTVMPKNEKYHGRNVSVTERCLEVNAIYSPTREEIPHPLVMSAGHLWDRTIYVLFNRGYFANLVLKPGEWEEAKARATGQLGNEIALFTRVFEKSERQHTLGTSTATGTSSSATGSGTSSIAPPPYTE